MTTAHRIKVRDAFSNRFGIKKKGHVYSLVIPGEATKPKPRLAVA